MEDWNKEDLEQYIEFTTQNHMTQEQVNRILAVELDGCEFDDELWNNRYNSKRNEYLKLKKNI